MVERMQARTGQQGLTNGLISDHLPPGYRRRAQQARSVRSFSSASYSSERDTTGDEFVDQQLDERTLAGAPDPGNHLYQRLVHERENAVGIHGARDQLHRYIFYAVIFPSLQQKIVSYKNLLRFAAPRAPTVDAPYAKYAGAAVIKREDTRDVSHAAGYTVACSSRPGSGFVDLRRGFRCPPI